MADREKKIDAVARAIMSEASIGTEQEKIAIGFACQRNKKHATDQTPTKEIRELAEKIVDGKIADNTQGANHWYSPRSMPKEGENTKNFDVGGGLEQTEGLSKKNYAPSWSKNRQPLKIDGVRPAYFKFYKL